MDLFQRLLLRRMENPKGFGIYYNPASGTTMAEQISAGRSTQRRLPDPSSSGTRCTPSWGLGYV
jgi:hypothetical protein